jgi:hypothetical protein
MKLIDFLIGLMNRKYYGKVVLTFQHGKLVNVVDEESHQDIVI